jgi:hypothetical protein
MTRARKTLPLATCPACRKTTVVMAPPEALCDVCATAPVPVAVWTSTVSIRGEREAVVCASPSAAERRRDRAIRSVFDAEWAERDCSRRGLRKPHTGLAQLDWLADRDVHVSDIERVEVLS